MKIECTPQELKELLNDNFKKLEIIAPSKIIKESLDNVLQTKVTKELANGKSASSTIVTTKDGIIAQMQ